MNEILPQLHHAHIASDALPLLLLQKIIFCSTSTPQFWDECHVFHSTGMAELGGKDAPPPQLGIDLNLPNWGRCAPYPPVPPSLLNERHGIHPNCGVEVKQKRIFCKKRSGKASKAMWA